MKLRPSLLMAMAFVTMVCFSSCYQKYTCHCDITYTGMAGLPDTLKEDYSITDSKASAKNKCSANSGTYDNNGIHTVEACYLY